MTHQPDDRPVTAGPTLMSLTDIAQMLDVSRDAAAEIAKHGTFPTPVAHLSPVTLWTRRSIENWLSQTTGPATHIEPDET